MPSTKPTPSSLTWKTEALITSWHVWTHCHHIFLAPHKLVPQSLSWSEGVYETSNLHSCDEKNDWVYHVHNDIWAIAVGWSTLSEWTWWRVHFLHCSMKEMWLLAMSSIQSHQFVTFSRVNFFTKIIFTNVSRCTIIFSRENLFLYGNFLSRLFSFAYTCCTMVLPPFKDFVARRLVMVPPFSH